MPKIHVYINEALVTPQFHRKAPLNARSMRRVARERRVGCGTPMITYGHGQLPLTSNPNSKQWMDGGAVDPFLAAQVLSNKSRHNLADPFTTGLLEIPGSRMQREPSAGATVFPNTAYESQFLRTRNRKKK